jgi:hypothetical protein
VWSSSCFLATSLPAASLTNEPTRPAGDIFVLVALLCALIPQVMGLHTLMGEVRAPDPPEGNYQVVDVDGKVLKANSAPKRKKSFVEKVGGVIFGSAGAIPTSQRGSVRPHWGKVVKHNGWLTKRMISLPDGRLSLSWPFLFDCRDSVLFTAFELK